MEMFQDGMKDIIVLGNIRCWVVKLSSTGSVVWQRCLGGSGEERGSRGQQTTDGGYIWWELQVQLTVMLLVGTRGYDWNGDPTSDFWVVKLNSTGTIVWQKNAGGNRYRCGIRCQADFRWRIYC
jgi:hypothetical protein